MVGNKSWVKEHTNTNITTAELHNILGVSETAVENNISFLRENGYIERVGSKKGRILESIVSVVKL